VRRGRDTSRARLASVLLALGVVLGCGPRAADSNLVLVSIDTLRADHLGAYGYERDTSPRLDAFFEPGTVFENATSSSPCTIPSVRQLLSGGFDVNEARAPLAEILERRGYATAAVVSQHQFHHALERDYARGFQHFDIQGEGELNHHRMTSRTADQVTDRALAWLAERDPERPFFLWLHYFDPHDPYEPPAAYRLWDRGRRSKRSGDRRTDLRTEKRTPEEPAPTAGYIFSPDDVAHLVDLYDGEIRFTDAEIGRVLDALEEGGLVEESVVAVIADHGEWLGENGLWDHCLTLREPELHVPLLIRSGGGPLAGRPRETRPASTVDLLPTLLGALGVPLPDGDYHGADLRSAPQDRVVFAFWQDLAVARSLEWKLLAAPEPAELHRIASDPRETRNLLAEEPARNAELTRQLESRRALRGQVARDLEDTLRHLRAIGYVE
jgi:arylsulfatase